MQFYDKIIGLPLFQGMSSSDLQDVTATTKFGFMKHNRNQTIVAEGMPCKNLLFLIDGEAEITSGFNDGAFTVTETICAPDVLEPERLFGLTQRYASTYRSRSQCSLLSVNKDAVMKLFSSHIVFRLNYLNMLSTYSQRCKDALWHSTAHEDTEELIMCFLRDHCRIAGGKKVFHIKMQQLADELHIQRLEVSNALNRLDDDGTIILQRGIITIPAAKQLQI